MTTESFFDVLTRAARHFQTHGYISKDELEEWLRQIDRAMRASLTPQYVLEKMMRDTLGSVYERLVERGGVLRANPGVERWTLERIKPSLRAELDRSILASANLIKLNREEAITKTLRRFSGWATSIPAGGSKATDKAEAKKDIRKPLASSTFIERRVLIDQSHKLVSAINRIVATDGGAIAGVWRSHWRQSGYDFRPDHKDRDEKVYLIRDNWAQRGGLVKASKNGYTDQITQPGEEVFCRCFYRYIYNLRSMPDDMMTGKGREELAKVRVA